MSTGITWGFFSEHLSLSRFPALYSTPCLLPPPTPQTKIDFNFSWVEQSYREKAMLILRGIQTVSARVVFIAGLPCAQSARGTEPHTHGIWSTSFRLVVTWLTERRYVRVYRLYGWGRGDYQKEGRGVSGVSLQVLIFYIGILNMVNWQLSKQDSHWLVSHDRIAGSCVNSLRWRDLFGSCPLTSELFY